MVGGPDGAAAMAVDREAVGAGAVLVPEEDIDDDVLSKILSASWPPPAVVDDKYGRYLWTPLGGSILKQRFDAVDSCRMKLIWAIIPGFYVTLYAVPEETMTDFPFLRSQEDLQECQGIRNLSVRGIPPEVGDKPHFCWEGYPGSPPTLGEVDRGFMCRVRWGSGKSAPPFTFSR